MESKEQRAVRRTVSAWLTAQMNTCGDTRNNPALSGIFRSGVATKVRGSVMLALEVIDHRLSELNESMREKYAIRSDKALIRFYMKGGNAFKCVIEPNGEGATRAGGGNSDWDTQIVIDPWAPAPIVATLYGLAEDIVLDEFAKLGIKIAGHIQDYVANGAILNPPDLERSIQDSWNANPAALVEYVLAPQDLTLDNPQTLRRIYDHERLGLWMTDRSPLKNKASAVAKCVPGQSYNDAIKPFVIYRLGFTWHATPVLAGTREEIRKPILMELIDITIPRINTIESVTVWEELSHGDDHIQPADIAVEVIPPLADNTETVWARLPLPNVAYHAAEQLTMLCEIADGSSKHTDKMVKRLERIKVIWQSDKMSKPALLTKMAQMIGVQNIQGLQTESHDRVANLLAQFQDEIDRVFPAIDQDATNLLQTIVKMMCYVAYQSDARSQLFNQNGSMKDDAISQAKAMRTQVRQTLQDLIDEGAIPKDVTACYSDDLALLDILLEQAYLDIAKIGFAGIAKSIVIRIKDFDQLQMSTAKIASQLSFDNQQCIFKRYSTPRATRISQESLLIVMVDGKADTLITLTTASPGEMPFSKDPVTGSDTYCPVLDIANQRKVAAALLQDYLMRTAMARQYDAILELIKMN